MLIELVVTSRMLYGMGKEGFIRKLSVISQKTRTPHVAIIVAAVLAILFSLLGKINVVAGLTDFAIFAVFIVVNASLIYLRYKEPNTKRGFRVPFSIGRFPVLPLLGIITTAFLLIHLDKMIVLIGMIMTAFGFVIYSFFEKRSGSSQEGEDGKESTGAAAKIKGKTKKRQKSR